MINLLFQDLPLRASSASGTALFVAADVCAILGITKHRDAVSRLAEDERGSLIVDTPGGPQTVACVTESGLYALIFRSRKKKAVEFRKWVTSEVLPAIRKTGGYGNAIGALEEKVGGMGLMICLIMDKLVDMEKLLGVNRCSPPITISEFFSRMNRHSTTEERADLGKLVTEFCRMKGFPIDETVNPIYGKVNAYPPEVLDAFLSKKA